MKYYGIDLTKFVMAIFVIGIHANVLSDISNPIVYNLVKSLENVAVPYFFISSAFLLELNSNGGIQKYKRYSLRFLRLYCVWSLIYLPLVVINCGTFGGGQALQYLKDFVFVGSHTYSWHLWYLLGSFYGGIFVYILQKMQQSKKAMLFWTMSLYIVGRGLTFIANNTTVENDVIRKLGYFVLNNFYSGRLLCVPLYLVMGICVADVYKKSANTVGDKKKSIIVWGVATVVAIVLQLIRTNEVCYLVAPICIFMFSTLIELPEKQQWCVLRNSSVVMYFFHMHCCWGITMLLPNISAIKKFVVVTLISFLVSLPVSQLMKRDSRWKKIFF